MIEFSALRPHTSRSPVGPGLSVRFAGRHRIVQARLVTKSDYFPPPDLLFVPIFSTGRAVQNVSSDCTRCVTQRYEVRSRICRLFRRTDWQIPAHRRIAGLGLALGSVWRALGLRPDTDALREPMWHEPMWREFQPAAGLRAGPRQGTSAAAYAASVLVRSATARTARIIPRGSQVAGCRRGQRNRVDGVDAPTWLLVLRRGLGCRGTPATGFVRQLCPCGLCGVSCSGRRSLNAFQPDCW